MYVNQVVGRYEKKELARPKTGKGIEIKNMMVQMSKSPNTYFNLWFQKDSEKETILKQEIDGSPFTYFWSEFNCAGWKDASLWAAIDGNGRASILAKIEDVPNPTSYYDWRWQDAA